MKHQPPDPTKPWTAEGLTPSGRVNAMMRWLSAWAPTYVWGLSRMIEEAISSGVRDATSPPCPSDWVTDEQLTSARERANQALEELRAYRRAAHGIFSDRYGRDCEERYRIAHDEALALVMKSIRQRG